MPTCANVEYVYTPHGKLPDESITNRPRARRRELASDGPRRVNCASVLMCPPTHFAVDYVINPWMQNAGADGVDSARAMRQWRALCAEILDHRRVDVVSAQLGAPDMCFTANAGLVRGTDFVRSNFLHVERRVEEIPFAAWFDDNGFTCHALPREVCFEGAGDALFDAREARLWMGHGIRTADAAAELLRRILGIEVTPLRLVDPRFYHLDTCFCPLSNGALVYFPGAFDDRANALIEASFDIDARVAVNDDDASRFACNMIDLGSHVIAAGGSRALSSRLEALQVHLVVVELDEFIKSGGGAKCLALPFDRPAALGAPRPSK